MRPDSRSGISRRAVRHKPGTRGKGPRWRWVAGCRNAARPGPWVRRQSTALSVPARSLVDTLVQRAPPPVADSYREVCAGTKLGQCARLAEPGAPLRNPPWLPLPASVVAVPDCAGVKGTAGCSLTLGDRTAAAPARRHQSRSVGVGCLRPAWTMAARVRQNRSGGSTVRCGRLCKGTSVERGRVAWISK